MDLGTTEEKVEAGRYDARTRGCQLFFADLQRVWSKCRRYAGFDDRGKPKKGSSPVGRRRGKPPPLHHPLG